MRATPGSFACPASSSRRRRCADRLRVALLGLLCVAASAAPTRAEDERPPGLRPGDVVDWYTVQPGDTLEGLTLRFLGDYRPWRDNWQLNPGVKDPNRLTPGQRIRLIMRRRAPAAEIVGLARRVEQKAHPNPWSAAHTGDRLKERDGVRTFEQSSADLAFDDGTRLRVGEQSVIFLREVGSKLVGMGRHELEVVEGQADVAGGAGGGADAPASDIEILVGGARARPRANESEAPQTRARRTADGVAQVMVYSGRSQVEAGGQTVDLPRGTGTAVDRGGKPTPPEPLLPAPRPLLPRSETVFEFANPGFAWEPVAGAKSYVVEVCQDPACGRLADRAFELEATRWIPFGLPVGTLYWRVSATSGSGLDGFASEPVAFRVTSYWRRPPDSELSSN